MIRGKPMCVICAEDEAPSEVAKRERINSRVSQQHEVPHSKYGRSRG